jgi:hypothetical protein
LHPNWEVPPTNNANVSDFSTGTNTIVTQLLFNLVEDIKDREERRECLD